jgi:4,5-DOPA dioxygenase extradiol
MSAAPMPAAFVGHGSPMNALAQNPCTRAWQALGASLPRPRVILVISAHWYIATTAVTAAARPRTIHDFHGFPRALYEVEYPAAGLPALAGELDEILRPLPVGRDEDRWGIDHGAWSVLVHMFPAADIPVVQLSIDATRPPDWHLELGRKLAPLRRRGVLVLASGNVVHNLREIDWGRPDGAYEWAVRFNRHASEVMSERPQDAARLVEHRDFAASAPTPDHFLPLLYLAGLAAEEGAGADVLLPDTYAYGSLSMTCYALAPLRPATDAGCCADRR